jgi:serine/threonine protein kinase
MATERGEADVKCGARAGETKWPRCTLAYAPPEMVHAVQDNREKPAQDMWALGVMAIVQRRTLNATQGIHMCAIGRSAYPWELPAPPQPPRGRQSRLRALPLLLLLLLLLCRDPAKQPSAAALVGSVSHIGMTTTQT